MKANQMKHSTLPYGHTKARPLARIIAYLIDWYIATMIAGIPIVLIATSIFHETSISQDLSRLPVHWAVIAGVLAILFYLGYYVVLERFVYKGQTFGKRIMKVKVIKMDGSDLDVWTILKREAIGVMLIEGYLANSSSYLRQIISIASGVDINDIAVYLFGIISAVSLLMGAASMSGRMLHDHLASTCEIDNREAQQGEAFHA